MQFESTTKPPVGIVYDSEFGATIDSVLTLALLHGLDGKNECRTAALSISSPSLEEAQLCDVIEKYYAGAATSNPFAQNMPLGLASAGTERDRALIASALLTKKDDSGKPVFVPRVQKLNDTAVAEVTIRNALTAQYDQNAIVVLAGPATNLVRLLDLPGGKEWATSKVKLLVLGGSAYQAVPAAAKRLLAEWPSPIVESGDDIGLALPFPAASIEKDFAYTPAHPIAEAYRAFRPMPYDAPVPAMAAMLYAVRPKENYFTLAESGKHRRLVVDPAQKERILKAYTELASAKPAVRTFRRPQAAKVVDDPANDKAKDLPPE